MIVGVDEAGRGPWAGPVVAGAVILDDTRPISGLRDSKKLSEKQREALWIEITEKCICYGVGMSSCAEIDAINILQATFLAMRRAVSNLSKKPVAAWVDGNQDPHLNMPTRLIVQGDALEPVISAASIIAKVTRDRLMQDLDAQFPGYGFAQHKGYGTRLHREALEKLGPSACHRRSFKPVKLY